MPRRRADKIDANQSAIVSELRKLGISVEVSHDDILVGYQNKTFWYEIKKGPRSEIKQSQTALLNNWKGHYKIVWTTQMILTDIGFTKE